MGRAPAPWSLLAWLERCTDYHFRLIHSPTLADPVDVQAGQANAAAVLVRLRALHALISQRERVAEERGVPTPEWESFYSFLRSVVKYDLCDGSFFGFDQLLRQVAPQQLQLALYGQAPSFNDLMQVQFRAAAGGRIAAWLASRPQEAAPPSGPTRPRSGAASKCALCGSSDHWARNHPADAPVTVPCNKCGLLHARAWGPKEIQTSCEEAKAAGVPAAPRRR